MQIDTALSAVLKKSPAVCLRDASDAALIQMIAGGNQRAMHVLFFRHNVTTFRFIVRLVHDASLAEDLVADIFLDVWRQADKFQRRSRVSTWLLAIARNNAVAALRRRHSDQSDIDVRELLQDPGDDPEPTILQKQRLSLLFPCLKQISNEHREIVDLVYYHGQSIDDVARILGIPRSTVKMRMFCA